MWWKIFRRRVLFIALLLLALAVIGLRRAPGVPSAEPTAQPASTQPVAPSSVPTGETPLPSPAPTPVPTPTPAPTPSPSPSPVPLRQPQLAAGKVDPAFWQSAQKQGSVSHWIYQTTDWAYNSGLPLDKGMQVYLPWGYDENGQYDVLFLLHPRYADEYFWLDDDTGTGITGSDWQPLPIANMLDNLIEQGYCKPMIVIALNGYPDYGARLNHLSELSYPQMEREFPEAILPFVVENFATYAEGSSPEQLRAARRHFGVLGASYGAYLAELSIMMPHPDLVSWYTLAGVGEVRQEILAQYWSSFPAEEYPIDLLCFVEGEYDDRYPVEKSYMRLSAWEERFTPEENLRLIMPAGLGHEDNVWAAALFNSAQLFFREPED